VAVGGVPPRPQHKAQWSESRPLQRGTIGWTTILEND
jgi:hypothetical protein